MTQPPIFRRETHNAPAGGNSTASTLTDEDDYEHARRVNDRSAERRAASPVFEDMHAAEQARRRARCCTVGEGATVRLMQLCSTDGTRSVLHRHQRHECAKDGRIELDPDHARQRRRLCRHAHRPACGRRQLLQGRHRLSWPAKTQTIDMNLVVNQFGEEDRERDQRLRRAEGRGAEDLPRHDRLQERLVPARSATRRRRC